jgi:hypothetical protein
MFEIEEAGSIISEAAGDGANVIFGAVIDESYGDQLMVTVIATGFSKASRASKRPAQQPIRQPLAGRITAIPNGLSDLRNLEAPTITRWGLDVNTDSEGEEAEDGHRIEKSNPNRPAFLRKIMD